MKRDTVYELSPISDERWERFVQRDPQASVFHSVEWLRALHRTYGYEPIAFTTSAPDQDLTNALVLCRVRSWLTGGRLVSLPFSDHCHPLVNSTEQLRAIILVLEIQRQAGGRTHFEIRWIEQPGRTRPSIALTHEYCLHRLDLLPSEEQLFRNFHKDCVQRKIRRAYREELRYEVGRSNELLEKFYQLLLLTRRRQGIPPQPIEWFHNLTACMGDKLAIRVASKRGRPVASVLTLRHNHTVVYKYGCSDRTFSNLGGMQLLLWRTIQEAKRDGVIELDMGRSETTNRGLIDFKERWGAIRSELSYLRSSGTSSRFSAIALGMRLATYIVPWTPSRVLVGAGRALYRHVGCV